MEITNDSISWTSEDIDIWSQFLRTATGSKLLGKLLETTPTLFEEGDTNKVLIRTGKVTGYMDAARSLLSLAQHTPAPAKSVQNYPALEDDGEWAGPKLSETPPNNQV